MKKQINYKMVKYLGETVLLIISVMVLVGLVCVFIKGTLVDENKCTMIECYRR